MVYDEPINRGKSGEIYENPIDKHNYSITVDVARGVEKDYSAFIVFDTTEFPYKIAKYRNNTIKPMLFPNVILDFTHITMRISYVK